MDASVTKPEPVGWWCERCLGIKDVNKCQDGHRLIAHYTATQVRQAWEEFADWINGGKNYSGRYDLLVLASEEARRRAKEW